MLVMKIVTVIIFILSTPFAQAHWEGIEMNAVRDFLNNIFKDNAAHVAIFDKKENSYFAHKQTPRATIIMCSDSRLDSSVFDETPINDHFTIRNIGNQVNTAEGSIEYGIHHVHTPVLLIIGHSGCGAIEAARGDFSQESSHIQQELKLLDVKGTKSVDDGVIKNVQHQVALAYDKFSDLVNSGKLMIFGTIYDFRDDFKKGHGRLILININGETDLKKLKEYPILEGVSDVTIGTGEMN